MSKVGRGFYERRLAQKQQELAAIELDLETVIKKVEEQKLMKQADLLITEINQIEQKLSNFDRQSNNRNVQMISLDESFRKIDHESAKNIARSLCSNFEGKDLGGSLLLLQKITMYMGQHCLNEMMSIMLDRNLNNIFDRDKNLGGCKIYPTGFSNITTEATELGFLQQLSQYHSNNNQTDITDIPDLNYSFRNSLCNSLRSGDRVIILVQDCDLLTNPQAFLTWFLQEFWKPLIEEIEQSAIAEYGLIRIVAVLTCNSKIDDCHLSTLPFCTVDTFNPYHLINIPLTDWTVEDIQNWLMEVKQLRRNDSEIQAQRIHAESEGIPNIICSILKERYSQ